MNIKNRLKKLQSQIIGNDSDFCGCEKETVFKMMPFGESEAATETTICETCHKPMPAPLQITFSFGNNIEVILPKTNFSREEFEEWQKNHVASKHISYEEYLAESEKETL